MLVKSVDIFTYTGSIEMYPVAPDTKALKILLWGAGGGGGSCHPTSILTPSIVQVGGGGGGGGYVEGWIDEPKIHLQFPYFLAHGGEGGMNSTGSPAELSWFLDPAQLYAEGGGGGAMVEAPSSDHGIVYGVGGHGGNAGGLLASNVSIGSQGGNGQASYGLPAFATGGQGGAAGQKSGASRGSTVAGVGINGTMNGFPGIPYGGGGGGACVRNIPLGQNVVGGRGADAFMVVISYTDIK